ncbi:MAG: hypothetical protein H6Q69_4831 [Firmicutes bacterium]|nr:hypothetical protein [Bacillota bacterium]
MYLNNLKNVLMKKNNPWLLSLILFILYFICLYILSGVIDSRHAGGEQYFLTILVNGIYLFPIIVILLLGIICLFNKEWSFSRQVESLTRK